MSARLLAALLVMTLLALPALADSPSFDRSIVVPVELPAGASMVKIPDTKQFRFNEFTGVLYKDGSWTLQGLFSHSGLLCATYETGARFGIGDAECRDVNWITRMQYVTRRQQCNNAQAEHRGGYHEPLLEYEFLQINCAELSLRCSGGRCNWARP